MIQVLRDQSTSGLEQTQDKEQTTVQCRFHVQAGFWAENTEK